MAKLDDVEISALADIDKLNTGNKDLEVPFVAWGIVFGLLLGLSLSMFKFQFESNSAVFFTCMVNVCLFGTLGGWIYHLCCTREEDKDAVFKAPDLSSDKT